MKRLILFSFILFFAIGCSDDCETCTLIHDNNYNEAWRKCNGYANRYGQDIQWEVTFTNFLGELCDNEKTEWIQSLDNMNQSLCSGVTAQYRQRLECN